MARATLLLLFLTGCAADVRPTVGECSFPDPALAMMGQSPESLHEMVRAFCGLVGVKIVPKP
jgi:hypothetical protein